MHVDTDKGNSDSIQHSIEHCDEAYYTNLRSKCADLVWNCLQGLISVLDAKEFKLIQSNLESNDFPPKSDNPIRITN